MTFSRSGAAIIGDVMVPAAEVLALKALVELRRPATVPEIAKAMDGAMSDASLYKLLSRLDEQRRLVSRQVAHVNVQGTSLRRVLWTATHASTQAFNERKSAYETQTSDIRSLAESTG